MNEQNAAGGTFFSPSCWRANTAGRERPETLIWRDYGISYWGERPGPRFEVLLTNPV